MSETRKSWLVRRFSNLDGRTIALLLGIFVAVLLLWGTFVVTPLKIFVVLLHEISHGMAAVVTGGEIVRIEINASQGGVCYTRGGVHFIVLTAGYLGSMLWGGAILLAASRTRLDKKIAIGIGAFVVIIALLYVRNAFGLVFSLIFGAAMIGMGLKLSERINDLVLRVIGVTSCLYAVLDIFDDVLRRPGIGSDADMLGEMTGIPGIVWGVIWIALAVATTALFLAASAKKQPAAAGGAAPP